MTSTTASEVSKDEILKLAELAKLDLNDGEATELQTDISRILGYVNQLSELDVENVEPTYQGTDLENVFREDEVQTDVSPEQLLALAAENKENQIKVPKVL